MWTQCIFLELFDGKNQHFKGTHSYFQKIFIKMPKSFSSIKPEFYFNSYFCSYLIFFLALSCKSKSHLEHIMNDGWGKKNKKINNCSCVGVGFWYH